MGLIAMLLVLSVRCYTCIALDRRITPEDWLWALSMALVAAALDTRSL